ncbi:MAG: hypothetical protein PHI06_15135 [Desulfobulbaceae bacterium]|nr:hypothetical protein [Desulfobulbaceae bacterium]
MDDSLRQQGSDTQQPKSSLVSLQVFNNILNWLAGFIRLTEEEQKDAGIWLGDQRYK